MHYQDEKFKVGQVWNYKTRAGEENSTIQIIKIDKFENEEAYIHVSVKGLNIKNPSMPSGRSESIGHLPFGRKAVLESVSALVYPNAELSGSPEGYQQWRAAFDAGKAGVFSISIAEAVSFVESTLSQ